MNHSGCLTSKERAVESVASGNGPRSTTPPRRGWQSMHWSGVTKNYARAVEGATSSFVNVEGARRSHYLRVCVPGLVIRPHAYLHLLFLSCW